MSTLQKLALWLCCSTAAVAHAAGGIKVHMHGDAVYAADGFLYLPSGQAPFAAILLIPDENGVTQRVTDAAAAFADAGFIAVALDLNRGLAPAAAVHTPQQIREDLDSALSFLATLNDFRRKSVGALGFGSGGGYARELASGGRHRAVAVEESPPAPATDAPAATTIAVLTISHAQSKDARRLEEAFFSKELGPAP